MAVSTTGMLALRGSCRLSPLLALRSAHTQQSTPTTLGGSRKEQTIPRRPYRSPVGYPSCPHPVPPNPLVPLSGCRISKATPRYQAKLDLPRRPRSPTLSRAERCRTCLQVYSVSWPLLPARVNLQVRRPHRASTAGTIVPRDLQLQKDRDTAEPPPVWPTKRQRQAQ